MFKTKSRQYQVKKKKCAFHSAGCRVASCSVPSMIFQVTMFLGWHRETPAKGHRYSLEGMSIWGYQKVHVE